MKVKANRTVAYGGKEYEAGEVFEMDDTHAKVNLFNGRVVSAEDEEKKPKREKPARETLHPKKGKKAKPAKEEDGGRYKRRDVRAEDETTRSEGDE